MDTTESGYDKTDYRTMKSRWRSGKHVGSQKPVMRGYCRVVQISRHYFTLPRGQVYATVPGGAMKGVGPQKVWQGRWRPKTAWTTLPNILAFRSDQDFDANGVQTATIDLDNVGMVETTGLNGIFHAIERGYYAPHRGFKPKGRPAVETKNSWFDILNDKSCQVMILAGYGDVVFPIFSGLVNDLDESSRPDRITLTCRDVGQVLTDQHIFANAKARGVTDPITFADRRDADRTDSVGHAADASNRTAGKGPRFVLDNSKETFWKSRDYDHGHPNELPWVQIGVPHGRYESFWLQPAYKDLECYVAIKARDRQAPGPGGAKKHDYSAHYADGEWIDEGNGNIPGTNIPWVKHIDRVRANERGYSLPRPGYDLGDDSKIRLYFTNLDRGKSGTGKGRAYRAGVIRFEAIRRKTKLAARKEEWILVDDLSDVVKTVFQWSGINAWEVESTGVRLKSNSTWNRGNTLIDIITAAAEQVGYVFYIKPPQSFDESEEALASTENELAIGVGVFRQNQAMRRANQTRDPVEQVSESSILQGINARFTDEPLAYNIRVRGKQRSKKKGGRTLGGDKTARYMYVYRPPWSRGTRGDVFNYYGGRDPHRTLSASPDFRNGNIKKYVVHHDEKLRSVDECKIAALFIAFREALESATATIEFPGFPPLQLDHQLAIYDTGTGLSTRMWIAAKQVEYQAGPQGHFKMSVGGALIDLPDITYVRDELVRALRNSNYNPGLSRWELKNNAHIYRNRPE